MKTALVCDWLTGMRGGERCLEAVCELYPDSDIYALVYFPGSVSSTIESHNIYTSYIQKLPCNSKTFRRYLPLFPNAIEQFNLSGYDIVLSFSHCVAKGVKVNKNVPHICYCHTPMRYAWHLRDQYVSTLPALKRFVANKVLDYLKKWDKKTSSRVTHFIANSKNVRNRISQAYQRDATVIYPPVNCSAFPLSANYENYYLVVSALVPYKRVDIAVKAFNDLKERLIIVGNGPELQRLKSLSGNNVEFVENADDKEVVRCMSGCKALIFPGEEDFGIVPLEAQACGKPVIAYAKGGALETVKGLDGQLQKKNATGIFFQEQTAESLKKAIRKFKDSNQFDPQLCRQNALRFDKGVYKKRIFNFIQSVVSKS